LLALRESYLFCRNILGLLLHPFKTVRVIYQGKDFSQAVLVFGFPVYVFVLGYASIRGARFIIGASKSPWGIIARSMGIFLIITTFICFVYLFYWGWKVVKNGKFKNQISK